MCDEHLSYGVVALENYCHFFLIVPFEKKNNKKTFELCS